MRLPRRRTYRAFAELDRFSDEQCRVFVGGVKRSRWRRLRHITAIMTIAVILLVLLGCVFGWIGYEFGDDIERMRSRLAFHGGLAIAIAAIVGLPTIGAILTKDFLLRRALRRVINTRGSCAGCGYGLTSLPVPVSGPIVCPECGHGLVVDVSLGEVVPDDNGVNRYMPSPDLVKPTIAWLTPRRKKWVLRIGIGGPLLAVLLLGLSWGGYEWFLRVQARRALALRPTPAEFDRRMLASQPAGSGEDDPDAWAQFYDADALVTKIDGPAWMMAFRSGTPPNSPYADFDLLRDDRVDRDQTDKEKQQNQANFKLSLKLLDLYRDAGVFNALDDMALRSRAVRPVQWPGPSQPLFMTTLPELGRCRNFARMNASRMALAAKDRDRAEFISAFEANLAISRMLTRGPFLIDSLVGVAVDGLTFDCLERTLATRPDRAWLDEIEAAMDRQVTGMPFSELVDDERLATIEYVCWIFSNPDLVRFGKYSPGLRRLNITPSNDQVLGSLGTLRSNVDGINSHFAMLTDLAKHDPFERVALLAGPDAGLQTNVNFVAWDWRRTLASYDLAQLQRRGMRVMVALERWRADHGTYPASLDELVRGPGALAPERLVDPYSGRRFGYRLVDKAPDGQAWYVLYSVGADGMDNMGRAIDRNDQHRALSLGDNVGFDYVINFDIIPPTPRTVDPPAGTDR